MRRRELFGHLTAAPLLAGRLRPPLRAGQAADAAGRDPAALLAINDLDRRIWQEELEPFVPARLYDMHSHLTRLEFDLDPKRGEGLKYRLGSGIFRKGGSFELLRGCDAALYPGRRVSYLIAPNPHPKCDFAGSNAFVAAEALKDPPSAAQMVVHPSMTAEDVDRAVRRHRFVGFKPYRWYSVTGDQDECRIPDFMPEHQLAVADRYGLVIRLHLSRKAAIADRANLDDLERLAGRFPRVRWLLAHCARSYSAWPLEQAASRLKSIPNLWYESSSVCETDAFDALFAVADPGRICYGSDDFAVGVTRGKYVSYGASWGEMNELNQTLNKAHCDGRLTFVRYEMLRAMRRAARHARLTPPQVERIFWDNAVELVASVRRDLARVLGPAG